MIFCTVTTLNRIHMAMVMARSVKEHHPDGKVAVCIVEEHVPSEARNNKHFDHIVLAKDLGHPDFYRHMFKYDLREGVWSLKPRIFQYVLSTFPEENKFIYLDTDIRVYSPFQEVDQILDQSPIVVTPHFTKPSVELELMQYQFGLFNTGFLAVNRSNETVRFLEWWTKRLNQYCYVDLKQGIHGDQKWLDHVPSFFDTHILKHPGYNVAWWNLYYRNVHHVQGQYSVGEQPLRFYHFCGYSGASNREVPDPRTLEAEYSRELAETAYNPCRKLPCSYEYYHSGEPIDINARLAYRSSPERYTTITNPFNMSNRTFLELEMKNLSQHGYGEPVRKRKKSSRNKIRKESRKTNQRKKGKKGKKEKK